MVTMRIGMLVGIWAAVASSDAANWPQFQCDPEKSGFQPHERIATSNRHMNTTATGGYGPEAWGFTNAWLAGQPVVGNGLVVIGSMTGRVFALSETNGQMAWSTDVGGGVLHSAAIHAGRVVVATQAGTLLGLDPLTGITQWTYRGAGKGYAAAPTTVDGMVYIGSKDGRFHAVDVATGEAQWVFEVGGSDDAGTARAAILCSAAVLDNRVFFGAENMHAYALDRTTGARIWRRALTGQSFVFGAEVGSNDERAGVSVSAGWAVASRQHGGVVMFRTQPVYSPVWLHENGETMLESATGTNWSGNPLGDTNDWRIEQRAVSRHLQSNAFLRTFWALDPATGVDRYAEPVPVLWTSGSGNTATPPVVDDASNRAWAVTRSVYSRLDSGSIVRPYGEIAKLHLHFDPAIYAQPNLGARAFSHFDCAGWPECQDAYGDVHKVSDEGELLTGCQNAILSSTWVSDGGWDTERERSFNVRYYSPADLGEAPLYGAAAGAVIANGRIFLRDTEGVKAYAAQ
jgi:outer membrane protein assembly factor BamB